MAIMDKLLTVAGKEDFTLDSRIGKTYVLKLCWNYGWMLIRGRVRSIGHQGISRDIFIGKRVELTQKKQLHIGSKTKLHDNVVINALSTEGIWIGNHCVIGKRGTLEATGGLGDLGKGIRIGNRSTFGSDCFFGAAGGIEIGDDVVAGQYIRFHSENHNYNDTTMLIREQGVTHQGIKIGNNCWIGSGAVFLDGAELGDGCVVAANAVVAKKFPDNSVVGGVPAKVIKMRGSKNE